MIVEVPSFQTVEEANPVRLRCSRVPRLGSLSLFSLAPDVVQTIPESTLLLEVQWGATAATQQPCEPNHEGRGEVGWGQIRSSWFR